jgi:hypothetical protein
MDMSQPQLDPDALRKLAINLNAPPPPGIASPISMPQPDLSITAPQKPFVMGPTGQTINQAPKGTLQGDQQERERLQNSGSGISQISKRIQDTQFGQNHPTLSKIIGGIAQTGATIGDIGLNTLGGGMGRLADQMIPGTQGHHDVLLHQANNAVNQDESNQEKEAQTQAEQARTGLTQEQTAELPAQDAERKSLEDAQIKNLLHPEAKTAFEGWRQQNPDAPVENFLKAQAENKPEKTVKPEDDLKSQLAAEEAKPTPDTAKVKNLQQRIKDLNPAAEQRMSFTINQAGEKGDKSETKQDHALNSEVMKVYTPAQESAERMNVMTDAYEKAIKNHDQQAMLNLLANHLGMTMGLQKGARMTKDIIREAQQSQPWLQGITAKFDSDGYLSGVTLSPQQMRQMVDLGHERYAEDTQKARSSAQYLGAKDDGPDRIPGKATINYYLGQANGDPEKAKALAREAGWTVK